MNIAIAIGATGFTLSVLIAAAVALFVVDQPVAGWVALLVALLGLLMMLGMIASTGRATRHLPPPKA
jgi:hypothetical protein